MFAKLILVPPFQTNSRDDDSRIDLLVMLPRHSIVGLVVPVLVGLFVDVDRRGASSRRRGREQSFPPSTDSKTFCLRF